MNVQKSLRNNERIITVCKQQYRGFHVTDDGKITIKCNGTIYRGEWVYGRILTKRHPYIITYHNDGYWAMRVLIDTIDQYTGQIDANGVEIYEHDMVADIVPAGTIVYRDCVGCGTVVCRDNQWVVSMLHVSISDYTVPLQGSMVVVHNNTWASATEYPSHYSDDDDDEDEDYEDYEDYE